MSDQIARFPCSGCGSQLTYQPGTATLVCERCGSTTDVPASEAGVHERSLEEAMLGAKEVGAGSFGVETEVRCTGCGAVSMLTKMADRCAFCDSPVVVLDTPDDLIRPESVLPFAIESKEAREKFRSWLSSLWFAPSDLVSDARGESIDGVYLPYWTFDSNAAATYTGERGDHEYRTVNDTDEEGNPVERKERYTVWSSTSGRVERHFDDELVCATDSLPTTLTERLAPWDLDALVPFDASWLAGFSAERYGIALEPAWVTAKERMRRQLNSDVEDEIGGDEQRVHDLTATHDDVHFKHVLLPLWISSYRYGDQVYRFTVNARTGAVSGVRPWSRIKLGLLAFFIFVLMFMFCGGFSCTGALLQGN